MVTPTTKTTRAAVPDHQIFAAATAGVISTHATAARVNAPVTLVSANRTVWNVSVIEREIWRVRTAGHVTLARTGTRANALP